MKSSTLKRLEALEAKISEEWDSVVFLWDWQRTHSDDPSSGSAEKGIRVPAGSTISLIWDYQPPTRQEE